MLNLFVAVLRRDLLLAWRARSDAMVSFGFFVIVIALFPMGVGAEPNLLREIAPGIIWVAALLSCLLALGRLFERDYADGTLEQQMLCGQPAVVWVSARILAFWMVTGLPLVLSAPVLGLWLDIHQAGVPALMLGLALGTPILSMLGAVGAALTLGLRGGGMLLALLILPLFVPVLIFGAGAVSAALSGSGATAYLLLLGAGCVTAMALTPWACAAALRIAME